MLRGEETAPHLFVYRTPAAEFELSRLEWPAEHDGKPVRLEHCGPQILFCKKPITKLADICQEIIDGYVVEQVLRPLQQAIAIS